LHKDKSIHDEITTPLFPAELEKRRSIILRLGSQDVNAAKTALGGRFGFGLRRMRLQGEGMRSCAGIN
jgi:hypothetical protein